MDQLRTFFTQLKKYHFWILCTIVVLVGLTSWYMATADLDATRVKSEADIKSAASKIQSVLGIQDHPNDSFIKGMDDLIRLQSYGIGKAWQRRYKQQESLLVWPDQLGQEFVDQVDTLRPIEAYATFPYNEAEEIDPQYREIYRNFVIDLMPSVAEIIGAKWYAELASAGEGTTSGGAAGSSSRSTYGGSSRSTYGGAGGAGGAYRSRGDGASGTEEEEVDDSVVFWSETNQQEILALHFGFASRAETPHTLDILYAQEDLWVLEAIMNVIKRTNGDADAHYNAAIKEIVSIQMGRTVRGRMGRVSPVFQEQVNMTGMGGGATSYGAGVPGAGASLDGATTTAATPGAPTSTQAGATTPDGGTTGAAPAAIDPAMGRYVDVDYNPLPPQDLRSALTSQDPKLAVYAVAKRMPVRMRFFMDQRKLNDLLAECGNSSLPIEVRQVRINCPEGLVSDNLSPAGGDGGSSYGASYTSPSSSYGGAGSSYGGGEGGSSRRSSRRSRSSSGGGGGAYGGAGMSRMGSSYGAGGGEGELEVDPNEIEVEVYGIVHIFNPVNEKQLNIELRQLDEPAPADPSAPVEPAVSPEESPTAVAPTVPPSRG